MLLLGEASNRLERFEESAEVKLVILERVVSAMEASQDDEGLNLKIDKE